MTVTFTPSVAAGTVAAPPSKSMAHRLLIGAALAKEISHITSLTLSDDIAATVDCLRALGAAIRLENRAAAVTGCAGDCVAPTEPLDCRESGSTLRFLIPLALTKGQPTVFTGSQSLMTRPLGVYRDLCREKGLRFRQEGNTVSVQGPLQAGAFTLPGHISSQFAGGLLFALPLLKGDSTLHLLPPVASAPYIDLTLQSLALFGIAVERPTPDTFFVRGNQQYHPADATVEGDYSNAAYLEALNLFGGRVAVSGLNPRSLQGDAVFYSHFKSLSQGTPTICLENCPDLAPLLFTVAAAKNGGVFTGTERLQYKESDRAAVMATELAKCGVTVTVAKNTVAVEPRGLHAPAEPLFAHNDHRVAMALAVLLSAVGGTLTGAEAVNKSYPDFFENLRALGIRFTQGDSQQPHKENLL